MSTSFPSNPYVILFNVMQIDIGIRGVVVCKSNTEWFHAKFIIYLYKRINIFYLDK